MEAGARLATAAIAAAGGFHLLLGEQDGILCDPYYPKYAHLRPEFVPTMRAYYDFLVRYEEWLNDPALTDVAPGGAPPCRIAGLPVGAEAAPGTVWALARHRPGYRVVHLINLLDQAGVEWNAPRTPPQPRTDLTVTVDLPAPARAAYWLTPDAALGRPQPLPVEGGATARVRIPALDTWGALVFVLPPGA